MQMKIKSAMYERGRRKIRLDVDTLDIEKNKTMFLFKDEILVYKLERCEIEQIGGDIMTFTGFEHAGANRHHEPIYIWRRIFIWP